MPRRVASSAAAGGLVVAVALWLPWFHRHLSRVLAPVGAERSLSGWDALGDAGPVVLALAAVAVVWGLVGSVGRWARVRRPSPFWLVAAGGLVLIVSVDAAAARIGVDELTTTTPSLGLAAALAGAVVVVLAGIAALVAEARTRTGPG